MCLTKIAKPIQVVEKRFVLFIYLFIFLRNVFVRSGHLEEFCEISVSKNIAKNHKITPSIESFLAKMQT